MERSSDVLPIVNPAPAAGAEFRIDVPPRKLWRLLTLFFELLPDANVVSRRVFLGVFDANGIMFWDTQAGLDATAGTLMRYMYPDYKFSQNNTAGHALGGTFAIDPSGRLWLPAGFSIRSDTINRQVGDQFSTQRLVVEQYPVG